MGFGAGSALTVIPIVSMFNSSGYQATFLAFGIAQGLVVFVLIAAGGLMATAQLAPIAQDFQIADVPVSLFGLPALTFALSIDRVLNGITRPFFGWMSDQLGREKIMIHRTMVTAGEGRQCTG